MPIEIPLVIPTTDEIPERQHEVQQAKVVFRRTRTQGQQVTERKHKDQVTTEHDIIDQMHDQLQKLENMTKKKAVDMQSYILRAEEAEKKMLRRKCSKEMRPINKC